MIAKDNPSLGPIVLYYIVNYYSYNTMGFVIYAFRSDIFTMIIHVNNLLMSM